MTIRSRLLSLLLPTLTALVSLIVLFFYLNWSNEILNSFKTQLQSTTIAIAQSIDPHEIEWINQHLNEADLNQNPRYLEYRQKLAQLKQQLPIDNLYIVKIEPSKNLEGYQQIILLDASHLNPSKTIPPGGTDFSETEEHKIYFTKKAFVTPIYEAQKTRERLISAYAPIMNAQEDVIALLGGDMGLLEIDRKLNSALLVILAGALITILMVIATVFLIANRISKPVQQLNQAALDIAAGNYEADIHVDGPKEIVELANTFNTMSECLVENISRLRESSLIRERMHGEYECALLLQHYMLQKVVEDFSHPHLQMKLIALNLSHPQKGLMLQLEKEYSDHLCLNWIESSERGFESLYHLNQVSAKPLDELQEYGFIACQFKDNCSRISYRVQKLFPPLVWSIKSQKFIRGNDQEISLAHQDMIFLYNSSFIEYFKSEEQIENWFGKVLRHFAEDGLETIHTMLTNELSFLTKRENLAKNFRILSLQVKI